MDCHTFLQILNLFVLLFFDIFLTYKSFSIREKYQKHGLLALLSWFYHATIFYIIILINKLFYPELGYWLLNNLKLDIRVWASPLILHIIVGVGIKEYLKIKYLEYLRKI